jgi:RHS (Retrotransposon Hot Spot) family protein
MPFFPNLIVRTVAIREFLLFFVDRPMNVYFLKHFPEDLKDFTDENSTILWEPDEGHTPVKYKFISSRIIATVSPDIGRIHKFQKNAKTFYMPCPSELQIRLMGLIYRKYAMDQDKITDEKIHKRVQKYGPFIRNSLCWSDFDFKDYEKARNEEFNKICATSTSLCAAIASPMHIMEQRLSFDSSSFSHRLARFVVVRDSAICCDTYRQTSYRFSSDEVLNRFHLEIGKLGIEQVMAHLKKANLGRVGIENSTPLFLEQLFRLHSLTGIEWKSQQMPLDQNENKFVDWKPFIVKLNQVERTITKVENMKAGVLYFPANQTFPCVDMYYKDENENLICIQATFAKEHVIQMSTYEEFNAAVGIGPENTKVNLFYLILPRNINQYTQRVKIESKWKGRIAFHALMPPDTFESKFPTSQVP